MDQNPYEPDNTTPQKSHSSGEAFESYLTHNILIMALCCLPLGIWGLITSREAESLHKAGDPSAYEVAAKARKIFIGGLIAGISFVTLFVFGQIAIQILAAIASSNS